MNDRHRLAIDDSDIALRMTIAALALGTAYIHSTLGGTRFTLNAIGYLLLAAAMVVPLGIARRHRSLIRVALAGYAAVTIVAWAVEGTFYATAYEAKAIELAIIVLVAVDFARHGGSPLARVRDELRSSGRHPHDRAAGRT